MNFRFNERFSQKGDMNFTPVGHVFEDEKKAKMLGLSIEEFYKTVEESKITKNNEEEVSQSDTFQKTTSEPKDKKETKEVKTEKETIEKEYETAYKGFYAEMNMANPENQQSQETADAWAEMKDMQFNLTKKGVTNATVIAGASEFITKLEETIAITKAELKETEKYSAYDFTIDAQSDEDADLFKNNPFWASAFETSKKEKEIAVA